MDNKTEQTNSSPVIYRASVGACILLTVLLIASAGFSAVSGFLFQPILTAFGCSCFAFLFMVTFRPAYVLAVIPAYILAYLLSGSFLTAATSLLVLAGGAVLTLCMLRRSDKTTTVIFTTAALGIGMIVLFLISFISTYGTLSGEAFSAFFHEIFETMQSSLEAAAQNAQKAIADANLGEAYNSAVMTPDVIRTLLNAIKLSLPAYLCVYFQIFGYLTVCFFCLLTKIFKCGKLVPSDYHVTVSKTAAVLFIICYVIYFFTPSSTVTILSAAAENLSLILSPALFLCGLRALKRKSSDPRRKTFFILYLIALIVLFFISPIISVFLLVLDGIGEIFYENRPRFF